MHFFPSESIKMLESECTHHREKERERPLKGRSTYRMFWIQVNPMTLGPNNFCSTYLVKICTLLLIKYHNTYWLLGTPTSGKFTINEMQKWKFKILFDLEKLKFQFITLKQKYIENYWRDRNSSELEGASQNCIHFDIFYQNIPGQKVEHGINIRIP